MANESKSIKKTDDSAMQLLFDIVGNNVKGIADIDSYYNLNGKYIFLEFIKCANRPFDYDPNQNWKEHYNHLSKIWEFSCKAEGSLWLVCYEVKREQFKLFKVASLDEEKIEFVSTVEQSLSEFKIWFQKLNSAVLNK